MLFRVLIPMLLMLMPVACDLPRDPHGTYEQVRGGTLRVGVVENGLWAQMQDGEAQGVEPQLVRRLAEQLDADIEWIELPEHELVTSLKQYQLDLMIGGLTTDVTWKSDAGMTSPYLNAVVEIGAPQDAAPVESIEGQRVGVLKGSALAVMVESRDGIPVPLTPQQLAIHDGLIAAPRWQLQGWGHVPTGIVLTRRRHAWALPPGENRWLAHVDRFLTQQRDEAQAMLIEAAAEMERP